MGHARDTERDAILIGGREQRAIVIVDYDDVWPSMAASLAQKIQDSLGPAALSVEHIGSTSVTGLAAKLVIDMLLVVADIDDEESYIVPMGSIGLRLRVREHGHRMLRTAELDFHVHVLPPETAEQIDYLDLRDWLRVSTADRALYESTKRTIAAKTWSDMNYYADAKSAVIQHILSHARNWRADQPTG
ncbi:MULTISPECIES: GrpB family protein [unclassified Cryobacterium]|uniref:GrpB family protein n=1 Tax=unclassified Cryobacterium TaxID=2649013 RepID=UPI0010690CAC|nr:MULTISPECIES: GrpB family protein [unclassified Cryobacterium]TFB92265.1 GrpB family protein [Cryobacterium sp. MDB2-A-1]TFC02739.1 GrpB family protein [Cryobacterium sp. MDB2-33-2]TFC08120.1 GrpB family protein [Cryobacterium sp. MDB2-A-2]TFC16246.1 GrpB family protein [Cryobacterium sp. MDB2-10]